MTAKAKTVVAHMTIMATLMAIVLAVHFSLPAAKSSSKSDAVDERFEIQVPEDQLEMDEALIYVLNNMTEGET